MHRIGVSVPARSRQPQHQLKQGVLKMVESKVIFIGDVMQEIRPSPSPISM